MAYNPSVYPRTARHYVPGDFRDGDLVVVAGRDPPTVGTVKTIGVTGRVIVRWWENGVFGGGTYAYEPFELRRVQIVPVGDEAQQTEGT